MMQKCVTLEENVSQLTHAAVRLDTKQDEREPKCDFTDKQLKITFL